MKKFLPILRIGAWISAAMFVVEFWGGVFVGAPWMWFAAGGAIAAIILFAITFHQIKGL